MLILKLNHLQPGVVVKRPSLSIKTPYVADVQTRLHEETILCHTAALGCCGLADKDASVLLAPIPKTKNSSKNKSQYRIYLAMIHEKGVETIIGIHPKLAEDITLSCIQNNVLKKLKNVKHMKREFTIFVKDKVDSRFDFCGIDCNGIPFILEVKNVPLADYEDITAKERKKKNYEQYDFNDKVAYFPDGYRKKQVDTVSPRALKHLSELTLIKKVSKTRCIMCYVIQRTDINRFQASNIDPIYKSALKNGVENGVEVITIVVNWHKDGSAYFVTDDIPINL